METNEPRKAVTTTARLAPISRERTEPLFNYQDQEQAIAKRKPKELNQ
jgi:hypothetical protein